MSKFYSLKVVDVRRETPEAVSVAFEIPAQLATAYQYKPGQYLTLKMNINGEELRRSYSICTSPTADRDLRIAVKEVKDGRVSTWINRNLKAGDVLEVMTPMGNFHTPMAGNNKRNFVLFAGGSGITPMMSILKSALSIEKNSSVTLVYANRDEDATIFRNELDKIAGENPERFKLISVFDQPKSSVPELQKGILTPEKVISIVENLIGVNRLDEIFICGPGPMMENVKTALEKLKVAEEKIHIEYFTAVIETLKKAEQDGGGFTSHVTVIQYGIENNFDMPSQGKSVLDAALEAGVDVPFSCKGAVCCTCRAKIMEGKASMDANFALTDDEVKQGFVLTCQAHPLTEKLVVDFDAI